MRPLFRFSVTLAAVIGLLSVGNSVAQAQQTPTPKPKATSPKAPRVPRTSIRRSSITSSSSTGTHTGSPTRAKPTYRKPTTTGGTSTTAIPGVTGQMYHRRTGQHAYVVQMRVRGWHKTLLMAQGSALTTRTRLRSQGYSAHIHDQGDQGAFVHYSMSNWRTHSMYNSSHSANQVATALRARGLSARVIRR